MLAIIVPSKWPDLFESFCEQNLQGLNVDTDIDICKILVRDGYLIQSKLDWYVVQGHHPFNYAKNINLGLAKAFDLNSKSDVILVNDDTGGLQTPVKLQQIAKEQGFGIVSPKICGLVNNPQQRVESKYVGETDKVAFICVYISRDVLDAIGLLDERFDKYGFDDDDYCHRAKLAGFRIGITDKVVINHAGNVSFQRKYGDNLGEAMLANQKLYEAKYG